MGTTPNKGFTTQANGTTNWGATTDANWLVADTAIDALDDQTAAFSTNATLISNSHHATTTTTPVTGIVKISNEVKDARGSALTLDARLDVALNEDGTLKSATAAADQWLSTSMTSPAYVTARTFKLTGVDVTAILTPGRPIKIDYSTSADTFYRVRNSTYSGGDTTVTIWTDDPAVINEAITAVYYTSFGTLGIPDKDASDFTPGAIPTSYLNYMMDCSCDVYYYDTSTYATPFTEDASRAKTNSGDIARIEYASGLKVGITYTALGGSISTVVYRVIKGGVDTTIATDTNTYDGTTGNLTDTDRT